MLFSGALATILLEHVKAFLEIFLGLYFVSVKLSRTKFTLDSFIVKIPSLPCQDQTIRKEVDITKVDIIELGDCNGKRDVLFQYIHEQMQCIFGSAWQLVYHLFANNIRTNFERCLVNTIRYQIALAEMEGIALVVGYDCL